MYFRKTIAIFPRHLSFCYQLILYGNLHLLSFQKYIVCQGFYLKPRLKTVLTGSGHLGWDVANLKQRNAFFINTFSRHRAICTMWCLHQKELINHDYPDGKTDSYILTVQSRHEDEHFRRIGGKVMLLWKASLTCALIV